MVETNLKTKQTGKKMGQINLKMVQTRKKIHQTIFRME